MAYLEREKSLKQISNNVYCEDFILECHIENMLLPNPYYDEPFLYLPNVLSDEVCKSIVDSVRGNEDAEAAMVKKSVLQGVVVPDIDEQIRKTLIHTLPEYLETIYRDAFAVAQQKIEAYFTLAMTTPTALQVLEYTRGDFYQKHADDSSELLNDQGNTAGFVCVVPQRKLTTVLFTTSWNAQPHDAYSFSGGELVFNYLYDAQENNIVLHPKAGDMVIFPSNPVFSHEVRPVKKGYRLTLVQWHNAIMY